MNTHVISELAWERMVTAVAKVRDRLRRAVQTLEQNRTPYAIIGDNAVAAWVGEVDESAVRNTQKVEILVWRADFDDVKAILELAGLVFCPTAKVATFLDGPTAKARECIHLTLADETLEISPPRQYDVSALTVGRVLNLDPLVRMLLTAFRRNDCVTVRDLIDVGLVDASWCARLPTELAERLHTLLDDPDG